MTGTKARILSAVNDCGASELDFRRPESWLKAWQARCLRERCQYGACRPVAQGGRPLTARSARETPRFQGAVSQAVCFSTKFPLGGNPARPRPVGWARGARPHVHQESLRPGRRGSRMPLDEWDEAQRCVTREHPRLPRSRGQQVAKHRSIMAAAQQRLGRMLLADTRRTDPHVELNPSTSAPGGPFFASLRFTTGEPK